MYELMKHYCTFLTLLKKDSEKITKKNVRLIRKLFRPKNMSNEVKMLQRCSIGNFQILKWLWKLLLWSLWVSMLVIWTYCWLLWRKFTPMILINSLKLSGKSFRSLDIFLQKVQYFIRTIHFLQSTGYPKLKFVKQSPFWFGDTNQTEMYVNFHSFISLFLLFFLSRLALE